MINETITVDEDLIFMFSWTNTVSKLNKLEFPKRDYEIIKDKIGEKINSEEYNFEELLVCSYYVANIILDNNKNIVSDKSNTVTDKFLSILEEKIEECLYLPTF